MVKRVLIATGGTGGHIFPALGLAKTLQERGVEVEIAGGDLTTNRFFPKDQKGHAISCATFSFKRPLSAIKGSYKITRGIQESLRLISKLEPDLIVGFGSFHSLPLLIAGKLKKVPLILHEANAYPGRVNRLMTRYCCFTAVQFIEAASHLKGKVVEAPIPLRAMMRIHKEGALKKLGLDPAKKTVLVFGGSQGAIAINEALAKLAPQLHNLQLIHLTGREEKRDFKQLYDKHNIKAFVAPFEEEMVPLWSAADLVIARAGASTIAESWNYSVPAILIPYPFATNDHQTKNANSAKSVGGALVLKESELKSRLGPTLEELFSGEKLATMRKALLLHQQKESKDFADLIINWKKDE